MPFAGITPPSNWLVLSSGFFVSRAIYLTLYSALTQNKGIISVSIASPGVVSLNLHGLNTGDCVEFTSGTLPTGFVQYTNYFVIFKDANSFWLATTYANANLGIKINTSGSQSGTINLNYIPWGGNGSTNFYLPDPTGSAFVGIGTSTGYSQNESVIFGSKNDDEMQGHYHNASGSFTETDNGDQNAGSIPPVLVNGWVTGTWPVTVSVTNPITDGTNGTPRTGLITKGKTVGIKYIICYQ
jgi:hypothetical protein